MDVSKIIADSIDAAVADAASGKFKGGIVNDADAVAEWDALLMNYANILLATYHDELAKTLSKHGIEI